MKISGCVIVSLLLVLPIFYASSATFVYSSVHEIFIHCLHKHSQPSHPISAVIYTPNNPSYSLVLQSYIRNLRFNESSTPKPLLILTASHESHVQAAVICAKTCGFHMRIRSGGHDYEGVSYVSKRRSNFFVLDMFNFRAINVSIEDQTAWVQAGATLGEVYYRIAEKSNIHGFPAGVCPTVGVGGHFSGGGYGNMMRKYGLSVDNIIDAQLIDVNGQLLNRESMGEDLFWAISGGGGSSFGVVMAYRINLVLVPPTVTVFRVHRTLEQNGANIAYKWQKVAHNLDSNIFIRMIIGVANTTTNTTTQTKTITTSFVALFLGDSQTLISLMNESFPELGLQIADCTEMSWLESVVYWADIPTGTPVEVVLSRVPHVLTHLKRKSDYLINPIPMDGWKFIFERMIELERPLLVFNPYGGRMGEILATAKPFPHRAGNIAKIQYATNWDEDGVQEANHYISLTRVLHGYMTPFVSQFPRKAFLCYRDLDLGINHHGNNSYLEGVVYGYNYFMDNFDRLVRVKTKVDPDNFFRNEQSIPTMPSHPQLHRPSISLGSSLMGEPFYLLFEGKILNTMGVESYVVS